MAELNITVRTGCQAAQSSYLKRKLGSLSILRNFIRVLAGRTEEQLLQADQDRMQEQLLQADQDRMQEQLLQADHDRMQE